MRRTLLAIGKGDTRCDSERGRRGNAAGLDRPQRLGSTWGAPPTCRLARNGVEHDVTRQSPDRGGFRIDHPLPGIPTSVERGGDCHETTLREVDPTAAAFATARGALARGGGARRRWLRPPDRIDAMTSPSAGRRASVGSGRQERFLSGPDNPRGLEVYRTRTQPDRPGRPLRRRRRPARKGGSVATGTQSTSPYRHHPLGPR